MLQVPSRMYLSVCLRCAHQLALPRRLNRSRCRLGQTRVSSRNYVLDTENTSANWRIRLNGPCAASMQPYVKSFRPLVINVARIVYGRVYVTVRCPSVCLSRLSTAALCCGGFAAVGPEQEISIDSIEAAAAARRSTANTNSATLSALVES